MSAFGISGLGSGISFDFAAALNRKYNIMQQEADATTKQADASMIGTQAAANLDRTKALLMPKEVMAGIKRTLAEAGLTAEQTKYVGDEARSRIGLNKANTSLVDMQREALWKSDVEETDINKEYLRTTPTNLSFRSTIGY